MVYIGIDVSSKELVVYGTTLKRKVVIKGSYETSKRGLDKLMKEAGREKKYIVFEAGNQLRWLARYFMKRSDVELHVVHPNEIKWIVKSGGKKTDKIDARKMAELARVNMLPRKVHIIEGEAAELRELTKARGKIQSKRIALINSVIGYLKQEGIKTPKGFFKTEDWKEVLLLMNLKDYQKSIIHALMEAIHSLALSEFNLKSDIESISNEKTELLETIPTIGKLASRTIIGALDTAERFDSKREAANYGALSPTIFQSGDMLNTGHINRDGRQEVRKVLLQCAHTLARMRAPEAKPLKNFYSRIEKKKGKKIAVVALSRKLLTLAYGVLKSGESYDPERLLPYKA